MNETKRERYIRILSGLGGADISAEACKELVELLKEQPERKKGEWIKISPANIFECSVCGQNVMTNDIDAYRFCHGCGADMRTE